MSDIRSHRRPAATAVGRRAVLALTKPYVDRFPDWQRRAAFLSAALLARALSPEARQLHHADLDVLIAEVEAGRAEFAQSVKDEPKHGRLEDLSFAFDRLLTILRETKV